MSNKAGIWKDAPEGTKFIVELDDGEVVFYKMEGIDLVFYVDDSWEYSVWDSLKELEQQVSCEKMIHFKPE